MGIFKHRFEYLQACNIFDHLIGFKEVHYCMELFGYSFVTEKMDKTQIVVFKYNSLIGKNQHKIALEYFNFGHTKKI